MRKIAFVAFALVTGSASASFAEIFDPAYFRCMADQLYGHPSDPLNGAPIAETRQGYGRTGWARRAYNYWSPMNRPHAQRFWLSSFNADVDNYALDEDTDLYPVYLLNATDIWVGPGPNNFTWFGNTYTTIYQLGYTGALDLPAGVAIDALCEAGCYSPEQEIRIDDRSKPVVDAYGSGQRSFMTLTPNATMESPTLMKNQIARWTVDIAPAQQDIVTLRMQSGGSLRVTTEHPLVTSEGVMKQAQNLAVGESLVKENGSPDPVVAIEKSKEFMKVYNLRPTTTDLTSNILVAQGYLTGSARYQNEYLKYLNRQLFRQKIPSAVILRKPPAGTVTAAQ